MGMGRKKDREKQQELWVAASEIVTTPGHVFYERLNAGKFDQRVEAICRKDYKSSSGRPSITPGTYFRMILLCYFEGNSFPIPGYSGHFRVGHTSGSVSLGRHTW